MKTETILSIWRALWEEECDLYWDKDGYPYMDAFQHRILNEEYKEAEKEKGSSLSDSEKEAIDKAFQRKKENAKLHWEMFINAQDDFVNHVLGRGEGLKTETIAVISSLIYQKMLEADTHLDSISDDSDDFLITFYEKKARIIEDPIEAKKEGKHWRKVFIDFSSHDWRYWEH